MSMVTFAARAAASSWTGRALQLVRRSVRRAGRTVIPPAGIALVILTAIGSGAPRQQPVPSADSVSGVYWAALDTAGYFGGLHWEERRQILVLDSTVPPGGVLFARNKDRIDPEVIEAGLRALPRWLRGLLESTEPPAAMTVESSDDVAVQRISRRDLDAFFGDAQKDVAAKWKAWHDAHPDAGGWIAFSSVHFATDGTASVYLERNCGPLCGSGLFVHVERQGSGWRASEVEPAWAS